MLAFTNLFKRRFLFRNFSPLLILFKDVIKDKWVLIDGSIWCRVWFQFMSMYLEKIIGRHLMKVEIATVFKGKLLGNGEGLDDLEYPKITNIIYLIP
jgi:hypothetical protein